MTLKVRGGKFRVKSLSVERLRMLLLSLFIELVEDMERRLSLLSDILCFWGIEFFKNFIFELYF